MSLNLIAIVPAAGVGQRAQHASREGVAVPKQYRLLRGESMLRHAVKALLADPRIDRVLVAVAAGDKQADAALHGLARTVVRECGGPSRAQTVMAALMQPEVAQADWVLVHDAARPGLPRQALARLIDACLTHDEGGLLALPVADTIKRAAPEAEYASTDSNALARVPAVQATVPRDTLWAAQTPQMFPPGTLLRALEHARESGLDVTDEASAMEHAGHAPRLVQGSVRNFKVTWPEDFELMEKWL